MKGRDDVFTFMHTQTHSVWIVVELQRPLQEGGCDSATQWPLAFIVHIHYHYVCCSQFRMFMQKNNHQKVCQSGSHMTSQLPDWLVVTWPHPPPGHTVSHFRQCPPVGRSLHRSVETVAAVEDYESLL